MFWAVRGHRPPAGGIDTASLIVVRLHAPIGGSVERFSNIGESVAITTVCA